MKLAHRIAGVLVAALLLAACDTRESHHVPRSTESYLRWEAPGVWGASTGARNIYWIDNERVLYVGKEEDEPHDQARLRIWTPVTGKVEVLGPARGELCYFRGYVRYSESISGVVATMKEGELGGVLEFVSDYLARHKELTALGFRRHQLNCRYYQTGDLAPGEACKVPLLAGDGFLGTQGGACEEDVQERKRALRSKGPQDQAARAELTRIEQEVARRPVRHHRENGQPILLPIEAKEIGPFASRLEYLEWRKQYLIPQSASKGNPTHLRGTWPKGEDYVAYLLSPSGALERVAIPITNYYVSSPGRVAVTKAGVVAMSPGMTIDRRVYHFGVVLFVDGRPAILDDGVTRDLALSPDGCRLAYVRQRGDATRTSPVVTRLRAIDLCRRG